MTTEVPDPGEGEGDRQEQALQAQLQRAHDATTSARDAIAEIARELRFPLAHSTRLREDHDAE